jgi:hypothetical protein
MVMVQSQPGQTACETMSQKNPSQEKRTGGLAQDVCPEFKPQYCKTKQNKNGQAKI